MTLNKRCPFFSQILVLLGIVLVAFGCAVQQKPQGGPKDVVPPKLLRATPANQTHNFNSKVIVLDFDKFFKLTNPFQEITISPDQEKKPEYNYTKKPKSLIITFKDSLLKNTTYVINFGKSIVDLHEGNILKNFTYVFSTGTHIDSLSISGKVIDTHTQDREKDVTVMLFSLKEDSVVFSTGTQFGKKKPSIYTTTDTAGNFTLSNLHEGLYKLYALKETSVNRIYDNENELIGIPNHIINLQNDTTGVMLKLFKQVPTKFRFLQPRFDLDGKISLVFNKPLEKPAVRVLFPVLNEDPYVFISKTRDTAQVYIKNMDFDSIKLVVFDNNKPIDTTITLQKLRKESYIRIISLATSVDARNALKPGTDLTITSNIPIAAYDQSLIVLTEDSTAVDFTLQQDTANLKRLTLKYKWKQKANYILTFNEGAVTGFWGEKNKKLAPKKFKLDKPENYSQLNLHITVPDTSKAYIVEFLNEQNSLLQSNSIRKNTTLTYKNLLSGKYKVRVVYDDNKNGKWDTGSAKENRQPENIWVDREVILLTPNFEADKNIEIPREIIL